MLLTSGVEIALASVDRGVFRRQLLVRPAEALCREDHVVTHPGELPQQLLWPTGQDHIIAGERQQLLAWGPKQCMARSSTQNAKYTTQYSNSIPQTSDIFCSRSHGYYMKNMLNAWLL